MREASGAPLAFGFRLEQLTLGLHTQANYMQAADMRNTMQTNRRSDYKSKLRAPQFPSQQGAP